VSKIAVRVIDECFVAGQYRKPGQIFFVDRDLFDRKQLPSCVQRVAAEQPPHADEFVEVRLG